MNEKILVSYATCTGSTRGVAEAIGETLAGGGVQVDVLSMQEVAVQRLVRRRSSRLERYPRLGRKPGPARK